MASQQERLRRGGFARILDFVVCVAEQPRDGLNPCIAPSHPHCKGDKARTSPALPKVLKRKIGQVCGQCGSIYRETRCRHHVYSCFLQMFLWEQFYVVALKPVK